MRWLESINIQERRAHYAFTTTLMRNGVKWVEKEGPVKSEFSVGVYYISRDVLIPYPRRPCACGACATLSLSLPCPQKYSSTKYYLYCFLNQLGGRHLTQNLSWHPTSLLWFMRDGFLDIVLAPVGQVLIVVPCTLSYKKERKNPTGIPSFLIQKRTVCRLLLVKLKQRNSLGIVTRSPINIMP